MVINWSVWVVRCLHPYAHMSVHTVCRRTYVRVSLRELLNPFLASANTRSCLWFPHTTPEPALFFRLGTLRLIGQQLPMHAHTQPLSVTWWRNSETCPHYMSLYVCVNGPRTFSPLPFMESSQKTCAAIGRLLSVRRHPIYSTFFPSWQVFAALFLENFLLMWENTNKYRHFQGKKTFDVVSVFFRFTFVFEMSSLQNERFCALIGGGDTPHSAGHTPICHFSPNFLFLFSLKNLCQ